MIISIGIEIDSVTVKHRKIGEDDLVEAPIENTAEHCITCNINDRPEFMLVCDHCNYNISHIQCLSPPIDYIPEEDWYCGDCCERFNLTNSWAEPIFANFEEFDNNINSSQLQNINSTNQEGPDRRIRTRGRSRRQV